MLIYVQWIVQHSLSEQAKVMTLKIFDSFEGTGKLSRSFIQNLKKKA